MAAPILLPEDIRRVEAAAFAQDPPAPLMERAGLAAAELARERLDDGQRVLVLAGPGNNGGDAFIVARHLAAWWHTVEVLFTGDAARLPADAAAALARWREAGGTLRTDWPGVRPDLIIDGLFGIGLARDLSGMHADLIARANASGVPILALDVPSGLDATTGAVHGTAIRATDTATFIALKPGLLTLDGPDHAGRVHVCPLGLDLSAAGGGAQIEDDTVADVVPPRRRNSHKGSHGDLWIVGGAPGMAGAALLAARAGLLLGAGRVLVGMQERSLALDPMHPELMLRAGVDDPELARAACIVVGPGLGTSASAAAALDACLARPVPVVIDADALNLIAADPAFANRMAARAAPAVMTPHPAEAGRLLGTGTAGVQADRLRGALELARRFRSHVVLKGVGSLCAAPDGRWWINTSGNPGLAAAGMGDVLAGIVGAFIAQGAAPDLALRAAVHLHGLAADRLRETLGGEPGMTASEVTLAARGEWHRLAAAGRRPH